MTILEDVVAAGGDKKPVEVEMVNGDLRLAALHPFIDGEILTTDSRGDIYTHSRNGNAGPGCVDICRVIPPRMMSPYLSHEPRTLAEAAFNMGWMARTMGHPISANRFKPGTDEHDRWFAGYTVKDNKISKGFSQ